MKNILLISILLTATGCIMPLKLDNTPLAVDESALLMKYNFVKPASCYFFFKDGDNRKQSIFISEKKESLLALKVRSKTAKIEGLTCYPDHANRDGSYSRQGHHLMGLPMTKTFEDIKPGSIIYVGDIEILAARKVDSVGERLVGKFLLGPLSNIGKAYGKLNVKDNLNKTLKEYENMVDAKVKKSIVRKKLFESVQVDMHREETN